MKEWVEVWELYRRAHRNYEHMGRESLALLDEAKSLMETQAGDIPVMQRIALYLDMAKRMRGLGERMADLTPGV